jgi:hypothetical protein
MRRRPRRTWHSSLVLKRDVDSAEDVVSLVTAIDPQLEGLLSSEEDQDKLLPLRGTHAAACPLDSMQLVSTCPSWPSHMRQLTSSFSSWRVHKYRRRFAALRHLIGHRRRRVEQRTPTLALHHGG